MRGANCVSAVAIGLVMAVPAAYAGHIQGSSIAAGSSETIRTDSGVPLPHGQYVLGTRFESTQSDPLSEAELMELREADPEADLHSVDSISTISFDWAYGLTERLTLGIHLPWVARNDIREAPHHHEDGEEPEEEHEVEALGDSSGIGDMTVFGLWRIQENAETGSSTGLLFGVKTPTGDTDEIADTGEKFETEFQPGTGSWDPFAGLAWSREVGAMTVAAHSTYTFASEGSQDTNMGDVWGYSAGIAWGLPSRGRARWNLVVELNGAWREREAIQGETVGNSSGSWLFLAPGVTFGWEQWSLLASFGYPLDDELNGNQDKLDYHYMLGVRYAP